MTDECPYKIRHLEKLKSSCLNTPRAENIHVISGLFMFSDFSFLSDFGVSKSVLRSVTAFLAKI